MKNRKRGQGFIPVLIAILGSLVFASAVVLNSTNNFSNGILLNNTLLDTSADANSTLINETANLTIPIENIPLPNQSVIANETVNLTTPIGNIFPINKSDNLSLSITITNQSVNLSEDMFNLSNITILNYSTIVTENLSVNLSNNATRLAKVFDEDNLEFDKESRSLYLQRRNNFSDISFSNITLDTNYILKVGAKNDKLRAIKISDNNFVIDLLYCKLQGRYCAFRINGVPVVRLHSFKEFGNNKQNSFEIDGNYVLKVNSIKFNHCDNKRFCHLGYEGYNIVNISVEMK